MRNELADYELYDFNSLYKRMSWLECKIASHNDLPIAQRLASRKHREYIGLMGRLSDIRVVVGKLLSSYESFLCQYRKLPVVVTPVLGKKLRIEYARQFDLMYPKSPFAPRVPVKQLDEGTGYGVSVYPAQTGLNQFHDKDGVWPVAASGVRYLPCLHRTFYEADALVQLLMSDITKPKSFTYRVVFFKDREAVYSCL